MTILTRGQYGNTIKPELGIYVGSAALSSMDGWMNYKEGAEILKLCSFDPLNFAKPVPQGWVCWDDDFGWMHASVDGNGNNLPDMDK